ncbi:MAG: (d)CMP kinase [Peptococcaceae bacterium]|nr:(d)CMP kinase [Peptococcaceae bacterium]
MCKKINIAIDGPAGAGKSTVARGVASMLGYRYVDTGAMYRAVTLLALEKNIDLDDHRALSELANNAKIDIIENSGEDIIILLNGVDVSEKIRAPLVTKNVSRVASVPGVRKALVAAQKVMAANGGVVMEGRDIGTVVIPDAPFKFYIVASAGERARRRAGDYKKMGLQVDIEKLIAEIEHRDRIDGSRATDPLRPAEDAQIIDCTGMTADEVINLIVNKVTEGCA